MKTHFLKTAVLFLLIQNIGAQAAWATAATPYPKMLPLDQYLMADRAAEIALARSAAPPSISTDAEVLVLARNGYEKAAEGKNGFVCLVQRSWMTASDDPQFWNPKLRAPICLNAPAVRSYLPIIVKRTDVILGGRSKAEMVAAIAAALDSSQLPPPGTGAMCYMMSKQGYLNDHDGHWHPHLMFFVPGTTPAEWGADLPGSPVMAAEDKDDRLTIFMMTVGHWSDGTSAAGGH